VSQKSVLGEMGCNLYVCMGAEVAQRACTRLRTQPFGSEGSNPDSQSRHALLSCLEPAAIDDSFSR